MNHHRERGAMIVYVPTEIEPERLTIDTYLPEIGGYGGEVAVSWDAGAGCRGFGWVLMSEIANLIWPHVHAWKHRRSVTSDRPYGVDWWECVCGARRSERPAS